MKKKLFITGAGGFIGRTLLNALNFEDYERIYCLGRNENDTIRQYVTKKNFTFLKGDISDPESYVRSIKSVDIVVHLAALTGKAEPEEYHKINSEGTKHLLEMSDRLGVQKFIFISTIAADFKNIEGYHYARSKIEAEHYVMNSGLPFTILRPTIVTGVGSPVLNSLLQLAKAPIVPIFGDGRVKIQPVHIDDLVNCILLAIQTSDLQGRTVTVAGSEQITLEAFIKALHIQAGGKKFRVIHLPVGPIRKILLMLESRYLRYMPITAGQLCTFTNDGIADTNPCINASEGKLKDVNEMIRLSLTPVEQSGRTSEELKKECVILTNYLIGRDPDDYVQKKYVHAHRARKLERDADLLDRVLVKAATSSAFFQKLADAYTGIVYRSALLRKKLLLLVAIMECCDSTYREVDKMNKRSAAPIFIQLTQKGIIYFVRLIIAIIVFSPFKLLSVLTTGTKKPV